jgi:hypothetical protein
MLAPILAAHKDSGEAADERATPPGRLLRSLPEFAALILMPICASLISSQQDLGGQCLTAASVARHEMRAAAALQMACLARARNG